MPHSLRDAWSGLMVQCRPGTAPPDEAVRIFVEFTSAEAAARGKMPPSAPMSRLSLNFVLSIHPDVCACLFWGTSCFVLVTIAAVADMHGRTFAGRVVSATLFDQNRFAVRALAP